MKTLYLAPVYYTNIRTYIAMCPECHRVEFRLPIDEAEDNYLPREVHHACPNPTG